MNLENLWKRYSELRCSKVYVKRLAANDNHKNQIYFGSNFKTLNIFPFEEIIADDGKEGKITRYKADVNFYWINDDGGVDIAPDSQLILYPKYPEVRFSGFLNNSETLHGNLMTERLAGRLLFLGTSDDNKIIGYVTAPDSALANEFNSVENLETNGVFKVITLVDNQVEKNSREKLLHELKRIHDLGWINSKRLDRNKNELLCVAPNCGGYTLEAELGITPNGYSQPDYLGWEVKQYAVGKFDRIKSVAVTLMTPEPTHGFYVTEGIEYFIRKYGYDDKKGREARINFGGVHKFNTLQKNTGLSLIIKGWDAAKREIDLEGFIGLKDDADNIAASWSFKSLLKHWNTKHANACYVPSINKKTDDLFSQQYAYGNLISLGIDTDFSLFLQQVYLGNVYYDPGIKLELPIEGVRNQNIKRRSQFRIKSVNLVELYRKNEVVDLNRL